MILSRALAALAAVALTASAGMQCALATDATLATATAPTVSTDAEQTVAAAPNASNPFSDVKPTDWAYQAVADLARDGIITGYPDGTFKGQRPVTRFELAVAVNRAVTMLEKRLATGETVSPADLAKVRRLVDEFGTELKNVQARLGALEKKTDRLQTEADASKKEADASAAELRLAHVGVNTWTRAGQYAETVNGYDIAGNATTKSSPFNAGTGGTNQDKNPFTTYQHPTAWTDFRIIVSGALDQRFRYAVRVEDRYTYAGSDINATTATAPAYCVNAACTVNNYPSLAPFDLSYGWVGYYSPGGLYARIGRIPQSEGAELGDINMQLGGSNNNGVQLGYFGKGWDAWAMMNVGYPAFQNSTGTTFACTGPGAACSSQQKQGNVGFSTVVAYTLPKARTTLGVTWNDQPAITNLAWNQYAAYCGQNPATAVSIVRANAALCPATTPATVPTLLTYNSAFGGRLPIGFNPANGIAPVTGAYQSATTHLSTATAYVSQKFGNRALPQFRVSAQASKRFGNNPLTGATWDGANGFQTGIAFASKGNLDNGPLAPAPGAAGSNVLEFQYQTYGLNAVGPDFGVSAPTVPFNGFYFPNSNGMNSYTFSADRWITRNFRLGLNYVHFGQNANVNIPAGSATCPQCFVGGINGNAAFLESWITL